VYQAIEVKGAKGKASDEQIAFLESVARAGGVGLLAYESKFVEFTLDVWDRIEDTSYGRVVEIKRFLIITGNNRLFVE
jgi:hypothetical protein